MTPIKWNQPDQIEVVLEDGSIVRGSPVFSGADNSFGKRVVYILGHPYYLNDDGSPYGDHPYHVRNKEAPAEPVPSRKLVGLRELSDILEIAPELNPSNYDHEQVCELNAKMVEACLHLRAILAELEPKPDPLLIEARGMVANDNVMRTPNQKQAILDGLAGNVQVDLVYRALKRGIELGDRK